METAFLEKVKCPICYKIPDTEILQCKNGHFICSVCESRMQSCPFCRVNLTLFGKIRNRALEGALDTIDFPCVNTKLGCRIKSKRNVLSTHEVLCNFGGKKLKLCQLLGYECDVDTFCRCPSSTTSHYSTAHQFAVCARSDIDLCLFPASVFHSEIPTWSPLFISESEHKPAFVINFNHNKDDKSVGIICVHIKTDLKTSNITKTDTELQIEMKSPNIQELPDLRCSIQTVDADHLKALMECPPFCIPFQVFLKYKKPYETSVKMELCFKEVSNGTTNTRLNLSLPVSRSPDSVNTCCPSLIM